MQDSGIMKTGAKYGLATRLLLAGWLTITGCEGSVSKTPGPNSKAIKTAQVNSQTDSSEDANMLTVQSEPFGQTEDGHEITAFSLRNKNGLKVGLINRGGILTSVEVPDRDGKFTNVTLHFTDPTQYLVN